jgi:rubrerythrin
MDFNLIQQDLIEKGRSETAGHAGKEIKETIAFITCACCGEYTIPINSEYEICPVCGWIADPYQNAHPDSTEGKNSICLHEARKMHQTRHR